MDLQEQYLQSQVEAAKPEELITMLYDGAVRFLRQAKANLVGKKLEESTYFLNRAGSIIVELNNCLDMSRGEISNSLRELYGYMLTRVAQANANRDVAMIDEVIGLIQELREAWTQSAVSA